MTARTAAAAAAAAWLLSTGCGGFGGGKRRPEPPEPALRIWAPSVVHWGPGDRRSFRFALENGSARTVHIGEPDTARAGVAIFAGGEPARACGVDPPTARPGGGEQGGGADRENTVSLAPGDQVELRVDLAAACADLGPGEYRFEVSYVSAAGDGGAAPRTSHGTLIVEGGGRAVGRAESATPRHRSQEP
jgi:hypothetical protein